MKQHKAWKRLLWAVDPLTTERELQKSAALAARTLVKYERAQIEPVYLLNQFPLGFPVELPEEVVTQANESAQDEINEIAVLTRLKNLLPVKVISKPFKNQKEIAETLIEYAKETESELIVVSTHAKRGVERWLTGSFVENLMLYSDVPLFIVNPHWRSVSDFNHILFPTDFSEEAHLAFKKVIALAQSLKSDITLFHQIPYIINPQIQDAFTSYPMYYKEAFQQEIEEKQKQAKNLASQAITAGIRAHTYIDYSLQGSAGEAILSFATKRHGIIAMTARSGRISANLLGSTTRKVVRGATCPIWVIHPHYLKGEQEKAERTEPTAA